MAQKHIIEQLKWRKYILEERTDKDNTNIIKKIDRNIRKLVKERKHQSIGKSIPFLYSEYETLNGEVYKEFYVYSN